MIPVEYAQCSYIHSSSNHRLQRVGICKTCPGDLVCCDVCSDRCHHGHYIEDAGTAMAFCDCGERGEASCNAIVAPIWSIIDPDEQSLHTINSTLHLSSPSSLLLATSSSVASHRSSIIPSSSPSSTTQRHARHEDMVDLAKLIHQVWLERQLLNEARG
jgi:hypothetical protein